MNGNPNDYKRRGESDMLNIDPDKYVRLALEAGALAEDRFRVAQLRAAIDAARNAYCPYSKFHVGAALLTVTANIYAGCNVENVMYNGMSHAELTAISNAIVHEGEIRIQEMTIWTPTPEPTPSCGGCRQLLREHAASLDTIIWSYCEDPTIQPLGMTVGQLLPHSFGPENLT